VDGFCSMASPTPGVRRSILAAKAELGPQHRPQRAALRKALEFGKIGGERGYSHWESVEYDLIRNLGAGPIT